MRAFYPPSTAIFGLTLLGLTVCFAPAQTPSALQEKVPAASDGYPLGPDSLPQPGAPVAKTFQFEMRDSKVYPGTVRNIRVYVPAAYKGDKPACVYVGLDGLGFRAPIVFDNLIAKGAMPVTIGIGLSPGVVPSAQAPENPRFDRSFEFDSRTDRLARFLLEEVIPEVERHRTPEGLPIHLSKDAKDRAIGGASTGAIGAFTVAWERPDAFSRVFSAVGTYVGMRGGESYYVLVRKTEPKPLRIFMQDGVHDEWMGGPEMGDWWMSNQTMERALAFAGYDVRHAWGVGTHNDRQATSVFPDAMRWLWRDWPNPVKAGNSENPVLQAILHSGEDWRITAENCPLVANLAANAKGEVFAGNETLLSSACSPIKTAGVLAFGPDGTRYWAAEANGAAGKISRSHGLSIELGKSLRVGDFTVRHNGDIYVTAETSRGDGELWLVRAHGEKVRLDTGLAGPSGLAFSPDGLWLLVMQNRSRWGLNYRVRSDGTLDQREPFYDVAVPAWADNSGAGTVAMDRDGRAYVATPLGVQVLDRNGRVTAILPLPSHRPVTSLCFGDKDFTMLYAASGNKIYKRKLRIAGAPPWAAPIKLPPWEAG